MLLEFHIIQNHSPANLNRDETGTPKSCLFGGVQRARISSQCLKRSIRKGDCFERALSEARIPLGTRTRKLPSLVGERVEAELLQEGVAPLLASELRVVAEDKASGFGNEKGKEQRREDEEAPRTAQTMFLTGDDVEAVARVIAARALELVGENSEKAVEALAKVKAAELQDAPELRHRRPVTVDVALFGRMVTSPAFQDVEASIQVAHAISTHRVEFEFDYFTAVDDLAGSEGQDDTGADMVGDVEFTSACFYKYFSLDTIELAENLDNGDDILAIVVPAFLEAAVLTNPSGKQNSFAAHNLPSVVLVEARPHPQPLSYANAFETPVRGGGLVDESVTALVRHVEKVNAVYEPETRARFWLSLDGHPAPEGVQAVSRLRELKEKVRELLKLPGKAE